MSVQQEEHSSHLDHKTRLRVKFTREKKEVTSFVVQVLVGEGRASEELIRYDTADSGPHKHVFVTGQAPRRIEIKDKYDPVRGWASTLTRAEMEARSFWTKQSGTAHWVSDDEESLADTS